MAGYLKDIAADFEEVCRAVSRRLTFLYYFREVHLASERGNLSKSAI